MSKNSMYVGMDVHQKTIDVTVAEGDRDGKVWRFGTIGGDLKAVDRMLDKLLGYKRPLHFVYEAGPCGFVLHRHLKGRGQDCTVVSPAAVPKKSSDRVKTDRRDADKLATSHRSGQLRAIHVPEPQDEAMRDVVRAREDAVEARRRERQHLNSFCLRHGRSYTKKKWTEVHRRWLSDQIFELAAERVTFEEYIAAIAECERRVERLTAQIDALLPAWHFGREVEALQALRGVSKIVAVTLMAELGDLTRFKPAQLMAFVGLIPGEHSSGEKRRQGQITKCGNAHVRRVLCEAGWAYDNPPAISRHLLKRQEHLSPEVREAAWKAQVRLCGRFMHLSRARKHRNKINTAIARELLGFVWQIAVVVSGDTPQIEKQEKEVYRLKRPVPRKVPGRRRERVAAPGA
jgi:transposase